MQVGAALRRLESALAGPLPGPAAHDLMTPAPRRGWPANVDAARARHAAGLVLLFEHDGRLHVVLTVRTDMGRHGGQVSLPGGAVDPGESLEQAALREAREEVGLDSGGVRILGQLSPVDVPVSGFRLHPVVASCSARPALRPSDREVARIVEVPLELLLAPGAVRALAIPRDGGTIEAPAFLPDGLQVWGATAMVLAELLTLLGWRGPAGL